jgi:hypothetical protein
VSKEGLPWHGSPVRQRRHDAQTTEEGEREEEEEGKRIINERIKFNVNVYANSRL